MKVVGACGILLSGRGEGPVGGEYCSVGWGGPALGARLSKNRWIQLYCVSLAHCYAWEKGGCVEEEEGLFKAKRHGLASPLDCQ